MRIAAIINGSSKHAQRAHEALLALGDVKVLHTKVADDTNKFARELVEENFELVIVAGGDGTLNQVVNEWLNMRVEKLPYLAAYPIGSANDFTRTIGFKNLATIIDNAKKGLVIPTDVFQLNADGNRRFCVNLCNCGIGANIARTVAKRRMTWPSKLNYFFATVAWLTVYKIPKVEMMIDENRLEIRSLLTAIGNGKYAGDGLGLCPHANINDGKMALTVIGKVSLFDFAKYLPKLRLVKQISDPRILYKTAEELRIRVLEGELSVETDGEFLVNMKKGQFVVIKTIKSALQVVKPY